MKNRRKGFRIDPLTNDIYTEERYDPAVVEEQEPTDEDEEEDEDESDEIEDEEEEGENESDEEDEVSVPSLLTFYIKHPVQFNVVGCTEDQLVQAGIELRHWFGGKYSPDHF